VQNEDIKAIIVERFNRTLKEKMYRYFTAKNTRRYVDVLPDFIYAYNHSRHRSIGMAPADVSPDNEDAIRARLYPAQKKSSNCNFKIGDSVRITMQRRPFHKGYSGNWSEEIFKVADRMLTVPVTYKLKDLASEDIKGTFYEDELQLVTKAEDELFDIEHILKTRKRVGKVEYFVKWRGYSAKFNSWVTALTKFLPNFTVQCKYGFVPEKYGRTIHDKTTAPNCLRWWRLGGRSYRIVGAGYF